MSWMAQLNECGVVDGPIIGGVVRPIIGGGVVLSIDVVCALVGGCVVMCMYGCRVFLVSSSVVGGCSGGVGEGSRVVVGRYGDVLTGGAPVCNSSIELDVNLLGKYTFFPSGCSHFM